MSVRHLSCQSFRSSWCAVTTSTWPNGSPQPLGWPRGVPWAGPVVSPGLALERETSSPQLRSGDRHHPAHGATGMQDAQDLWGPLSTWFPTLQCRKGQSP